MGRADLFQKVLHVLSPAHPLTSLFVLWTHLPSSSSPNMLSPRPPQGLFTLFTFPGHLLSLLFVWLMYWFARAAITKCHRLQKLLSHSSGGYKSEIKASTALVLSEGCALLRQLFQALS